MEFLPSDILSAVIFPVIWLNTTMYAYNNA